MFEKPGQMEFWADDAQWIHEVRERLSEWLFQEDPDLHLFYLGVLFGLEQGERITERRFYRDEISKLEEELGELEAKLEKAKLEMASMRERAATEQLRRELAEGGGNGQRSL